MSNGKDKQPQKQIPCGDDKREPKRPTKAMTVTMKRVALVDDPFRLKYWMSLDFDLPALLDRKNVV